MLKIKKILVVVDPQRDFISGSLGSEYASGIVPSIVNKIRKFDGDYIFVTRDMHYENYLETMEGEKLPVKHCIAGTEGFEIEPNIESALYDSELRNKNVTYISKNTFGSFDLVTELEYLSSDGSFLDVEFVGYCTDICVVSNVLMSKARLYQDGKVSVDASCCAGTSGRRHMAAIEVMESCQIEINNK